MARVTPDTNRVGTFAEAHGITPTDVIRWNLQYFIDNSTLFLQVGDDLYLAPPLSASGHELIVNGGRLVVNDKLLVVN